MCGIGALVEGVTTWRVPTTHPLHAMWTTFPSSSHHVESFSWHDLHRKLARRGPDHVEECCVEGRLCGGVRLAAGVLFLRGEPTPQPCADTEGRRLLWNGEVFGGVEISSDENDTRVVLNCMRNTSDLATTLRGIQGPYAFVFWNETTKTLWFGKDRWGRRSLLVRMPLCAGDVFAVSSVAPDAESRIPSHETAQRKWVELPTTGVYGLRMAPMSETNDVVAEFLHVPWHVEVERSEAFNGDDVVKAFMVVLQGAMERRLRCLRPRQDCDGAAARVGVLFSGGIDSLVLAALADQILPEDEPIDLLNVAYGPDPMHAPDRQTGRDGVEELRSVSRRPWRLVEIDFALNDMAAQQAYIYSLVYPCGTIMDVNIGAVLWFGARGAGCIRSSSEQEPYASSARVLLLGMGADEQLAGYARHRRVFHTGGWDALQTELDMDFARLWRRNLGRDDRVVADHGKEARYPFLDEEFVSFLRRVPLPSICDMTLPPGVGDKKILRQVALQLGLPRASVLPKRAVQFGTRIANPKARGDEEVTTATQLEHTTRPARMGNRIS